MKQTTNSLASDQLQDAYVQYRAQQHVFTGQSSRFTPHTYFRLARQLRNKVLFVAIRTQISATLHTPPTIIVIGAVVVG
jgi:hypothetical protein